MLIDASSRPEALAETGLRWRAGARFAVGWKGHLYVSGITAGQESADCLITRLEAGEHLDRLIGDLCGVFGLFVHDLARGGWQIATDNAGLYKIFWDERGAATSLLELTRARGTRAAQLLPAALIEFLAHGAVYGPGTFIAGVRKLRWDEMLEVPAAGGPPRLLTKRLEEPSGDDGDSVVASFAPLARSLAGLKVSADITGGFDTRLITCLLYQAGAEFDLALAGRADSADVRIATTIARMLERPLFVTPHDLSRVEEELPQVFRDGDGQVDCCTFHRLRQHCLARLGRGVQVMTHGAGGAHFKDFFSAQDFPRYGSAVVNFERFYDLRVAPIRIPRHYLTEQGATLLAQVRPRALAQFAELEAATNSQSYDRAHYFLRASEVDGRPYSSYINLGLDVAAPLLDWRNVRIAIKLSPWRRFLNGWHRRVLTAHCPKLAALRTTEGVSASSELRHLLPDIIGYVGMNGSRVAKKVSERLRGKPVLVRLGAVTVNEPGLLPAIRASDAFATALDALKDAGLFAPDLRCNDILGRHVGRVLTIGLLLRHIEQPAKTTAAPLLRRADGLNSWPVSDRAVRDRTE
jgi:hypothetical protein